MPQTPPTPASPDKPQQPTTTQGLLAKVAGFLMGITGLPEGVTPDTFLGPQLGAAAAPAQDAGVAAGMLLPLPGKGGFTRKLVGEVVDNAGRPLARDLGAAAQTVFHGSGRAEPPSLAKVLEKGPSRGWAASPAVYASDAPEIAARYASLAEKPGWIQAGQGAAAAANAAGVPPIVSELLLALKMPTEVPATIRTVKDAAHNAAQWLKIQNPESVVERARWIINNTPLEQLAKYFEFTPGRPMQPGFIHEMKLHADPARIVDWSQDVLKQSPEVRAGMLDVLGKLGLQDATGSTSGSALISRIQRTLAGAKAEAEMPGLMRSAGIEGVKYPSGVFRGAVGRQGATNFAIYGDDLLELVKRYPILGALLGSSAATQIKQDVPPAPTKK